MSPKILIVEDEILVATQLSHRLAAQGFQILELAVSGEEALRLCAAHSPDLILMDIGLAGQINGIEAAQKIRLSSNAPIIFITGYADEGLDLLLPSIQPALCLVKPVQPVQVQQAIGWLLGKSS